MAIVLLDAHSQYSRETTAVKVQKTVANTLGNSAGGVLGAAGGFIIGSVISQDCDAGKYCFISPGVLIGTGLGYYFGTSYGLHITRKFIGENSKYSNSLLWSSIGMALGVSSIFLLKDNSTASTYAYLGFAHVFPPIVVSF